ncbi:hypothetical protein D3C87_1432220 [compost metagenome]
MARTDALSLGIRRCLEEAGQAHGVKAARHRGINDRGHSQVFTGVNRALWRHRLNGFCNLVPYGWITCVLNRCVRAANQVRIRRDCGVDKDPATTFYETTEALSVFWHRSTEIGHEATGQIKRLDIAFDKRCATSCAADDHDGQLTCMHGFHEGRSKRGTFFHQRFSGFRTTIPNCDFSSCCKQCAGEAGTHQTSADYRYCFSHLLIPHMGEERSPGYLRPES